MLWQDGDYDTLLREARRIYADPPEALVRAVAVNGRYFANDVPLVSRLPGRGFCGGNLREEALLDYATYGLVPVAAPENVRRTCRAILCGVAVALLVNVLIAAMPLFGAGWRLPPR